MLTKVTTEEAAPTQARFPLVNSLHKSNPAAPSGWVIEWMKRYLGAKNTATAMSAMARFMRRKLTGVLWDKCTVYILTYGTVKQVTKNVHLVLRISLKTSWIAMLRVLSPMYGKKILAAWFVARQVRRWLVKRGTSLFNSFCSGIAKLVTGFLMPVLT